MIIFGHCLSAALIDCSSEDVFLVSGDFISYSIPFRRMSGECRLFSGRNSMLYPAKARTFATLISCGHGLRSS